MQNTFTVGGVTLSVVQSPQTPQWRVADVAKYFNVSDQAVYTWIYKGLLPYHRTLGGHYRFVEADVKAAQLQLEQKH